MTPALMLFEKALTINCKSTWPGLDASIYVQASIAIYTTELDHVINFLIFCTACLVWG